MQILKLSICFTYFHMWLEHVKTIVSMQLGNKHLQCAWIKTRTRLYPETWNSIILKKVWPAICWKQRFSLWFMSWFVSAFLLYYIYCCGSQSFLFALHPESIWPCRPTMFIWYDFTIIILSDWMSTLNFRIEV